MGELQKRMAAEFKQFNKKEVNFLLKPFYEIVEEMRKDINENTLPETKLINLGDYVLVDKNVLKKWLADE